MKATRIGLPLVALVLAPCAASLVSGQSPTKSDQALLQGTWICTTTLKDGENVKTWIGVKAEIEGDNITWHYPQKDGGYKSETCKFRIDAGKRTFDWWRPAKPGAIDYRLYSVTETEMRMTTNLDFKTRPEALDNGRWQFTCKRLPNEKR